MRSTIKLFLTLLTVVVILVAWITHQLKNPDIRLLAGILLAGTLATFFFFNLMDHRDEKRKRKLRESKSNSNTAGVSSRVKRSEGSFALKEKKTGLTWGGGNIKASEATRGTKRNFLGR